MKKLLSLLAVMLIMSLTLTACQLFDKGDETPDSTDTPAENTPENDEKPEEKPQCIHTSVIDDAVAATCTEDGLTACVHCSTCNEILVAQNVIPAAHKYGEWVDVKIADCFFDGEQQRVCSVCENEDTQVVPHLEHIFVQNEETKLFACSFSEVIVAK